MIKLLKVWLVVAVIGMVGSVLYTEAGWFSRGEAVVEPEVVVTAPQLSYVVVSREGIVLSEIYSDGQITLKEGSAALTIIRLAEIRANQQTLYETKITRLQNAVLKAKDIITSLQQRPVQVANPAELDLDEPPEPRSGK